MKTDVAGYKGKVEQLPLAKITGTLDGMTRTFEMPVLSADKCAKICMELVSMNVAYPIFFYMIYDKFKPSLLKCLAIATDMSESEIDVFDRMFTQEELSQVWDLCLTQMRCVYDENYRIDTYELPWMQAMAIYQIGEVIKGV